MTTPVSPTGVERAREIAHQQRLMMFLEILSAMGGYSDASDAPDHWLNAFCEAHEGRDPDTYNLAERLGYTRTSHDTSYDTSTVRLTDAGRAALAALSAQTDERALTITVDGDDVRIDHPGAMPWEQVHAALMQVRDVVGRRLLDKADQCPAKPKGDHLGTPAPQTASVPDELVELRAKATKGPWRVGQPGEARHG